MDERTQEVSIFCNQLCRQGYFLGHRGNRIEPIPAMVISLEGRINSPDYYVSENHEKTQLMLSLSRDSAE